MKLKIRISVTDRCNLNCKYCKPNFYLKKKNVLSFEEIKDILLFFLKNFNLKEIKFTGGEPLLRNGFINLIGMVSSLKLKGIERISLTTNGILLKEMAKGLKEKGIDGVNVSVDTLKKDKFKYLTEGNLNSVLKGIEKAKEERIPIKINTVLIKGINDDEIMDLLNWSFNEGLLLRFIEFMPFNSVFKWERNKFISKDEILSKISKYGEVKEKENNGTAKIYYFNKFYIFGIIPSVSEPFCINCNRLRITSDGFLLSCLKKEKGIDLKEIFKSKEKEEEVKEKIKEIIYLKKNMKEKFLSNLSMVSLGG